MSTQSHTKIKTCITEYFLMQSHNQQVLFMINYKTQIIFKMVE